MEWLDVRVLKKAIAYFSPYDDQFERTRAWLLVPLMVLSAVVAVMNLAMVYAVHGVFLPLCALAPFFIVLFLWFLKKGRGPVRVGFLYCLYMEFLLIQAYLLVHTDIAVLWLALIPMIAVFTSGTRAALWLILPPFLPTVVIRVSFLVFLPDQLPFRSFSNPRLLYEEISYALSVFILLSIAIIVETLSKRLYISWRHEQSEVEREMEARKANEFHLASSLSLLEALFSSIPAAVFVKDGELRYSRCSAAFCDCLGLKPDEIIGRRSPDVYRDSYTMLHEEADHLILDTGTVQCYSARIFPRDGGEKDALFLKTPIKNEAGVVTGLIGVMVDETDRKTTERNLQVQLDQRRSALSLLAHDLRNPIGSFRSLVHSLREDVDLDPREVNMVLLELEKSLDSLWGLVQDLLEWAKSDAGLEDFRPEAHLLSGICNQELPFFNQASERKGLALEWHVPADLEIYGDKRMIAAILRNLVGNAIKFTAEGSVSVSAIPGSLGVGADQEGVWLEIRDTGIGMQDNYLRNLVTVGAVSSRKGTAGEPGTGLGIPLCRRMAERHGGTLRVESLEGKGSVFTVFFPAAPSHEAPPQVSSPDAI